MYLPYFQVKVFFYFFFPSAIQKQGAYFFRGLVLCGKIRYIVMLAEFDFYQQNCQCIHTPSSHAEAGKRRLLSPRLLPAAMVLGHRGLWPAQRMNHNHMCASSCTFPCSSGSLLPQLLAVEAMQSRRGLRVLFGLLEGSREPVLLR